MKRLLMFILILGLIASFAFAGDKISGDTRVDAVCNPVTETTVYAIDAGAIYRAGFLTFGADAYYDTNKDLDIGFPVIATFGGLAIKAEPGVDNILLADGTIYVFDGSVTYNLGVLSASYGFGYGTDKILSMKAAFAITDLIPGVVFDAKWIDADNIDADVLGTVEMGVTVKY